jgi:hypothetical protein
MTPAEVAAALVAHPRFQWGRRMRILLSGSRGHNEGTVVAAWDNEAGTLVVRWDSGTRETPIADITRPWGAADGDESVACVATKPLVILPDLADPATAGVLLEALVREDVFAVVYYGVNVKGVLHASLRCGDRRIPEEVVGATLGEAVARALLAVWGPA